MAAPVGAEACDGLELEAMRALDCSWLPCTVSLSSCGRGLCIDFGSQEPEDMILTELEMLKCLRFRSIPLQGDDCSHIEQGKHVLAACKSQFPDCFYDAKVVKVLRVRHSQRINCRCTFTVKLLQRDVEGNTFTVSSSSIMRLTEKSIKDHPVISEFLKSVESHAIYPASPFFPFNQENGVEEDQDRLLEEQKACYMFGDLEDGISRDILFGIGMKVEKKGQAQRRLFDEFDASSLPVQGPDEQIPLQESARVPVKQQLDVEVEVPIPFGSSVFELSNNKSRLSPLAARAALASIVSAAHSVVTNGTKAGDSCIIGSVSPLRNKSLQVSSPIPVASESIDSREIETRLTNETKVREPTKISRITRWTARSGFAVANCENQEKSCDEEIQKSTLANTRRFTRSSGLAERENVITVEQNLDSDVTQMTTTNRNSTKRKVSEKNEKVSSPVDDEFHGPSKEKVEKNVEYKKKIKEKASGAKQNDGEENSDALKIVQQNEGSRESIHGQKRKLASSRKQERRFSPRLQFLPRTRSQGKSLL